MKLLTRISLFSTIATTALFSLASGAWGQTTVTGDPQMDFTANLNAECDFVATDGKLDHKTATQYKTLTTEDGTGEQGIYGINCNSTGGTLTLTTFNKPTSTDFTDAQVTFDNGIDNVVYDIDTAGSPTILTGSEIPLILGDNTVNVSVEANFSTAVDANNTTQYDLSIIADVVP
ncbi:hypothetical protein NIES4102_38080 [Chondrocystis sp. NIES-4102]|nr:hypothetical protein NIES4102_38080 [Chondrocystis sp. NIES-4102]